MAALSFTTVPPPRTAAAALVMVLASACSSGLATIPGPRGAVSEGELVVRRGRFESRFLLTGELQAVNADQLVVPRIPNWQTTIRWLEAEGTVVAAGQRVVEFDTSSFASDFGEKVLARDQAQGDLEDAEAASGSDRAEKEFQVDQKRIAVERTRVAAAIPAEFQRGKEWQDNQIALRRAETELEKSREDLASATAAGAETVRQKHIAYDKAARELEASRQAMEGMVLEATRAGILVVGEHPWEGRKFQVGDSVWVGLPVVSLPDLSTMRVVAKLSDVDDGRIAPGLPVACTMDAYPDRTYTGRIAEIMPVAQEQARRSLRRSYDVRIDLDAGDPERMRPGMSVKVDVTPPAREGVLLVPRVGLSWSGGAAHARLTSGKEVTVTLGPCNNDVCIVDGGLSEGDRLRGGV